MVNNRPNATGDDYVPVRPLGVQVNEVHEHRWDPISGRMHQTVNAGDYVHRVITGAVTTAATGTTVSLGNFTAGSRDEVFVDYEAFGDTGTVAASTQQLGYIQIDQAGTILRQFYLDLTTNAATPLAPGFPRYRHLNSPTQHEPLFHIQAGTVCNVKWVSITSTSATVFVNFAGNRLSFNSVTAPVGIV